MQKYTSSNTSINSGKLPRVYGNITVPAGATLLDYGCGKYTDHIRAALPGVDYLPFDPFNQPESVNLESATRAGIACANRRPVTVVCSNVLNVIDSDAEVQKIADRIQRYVTRSGGIGYVTVYTGNRSGVGRQTGPDQYQRNQPLRDYLRFFRSAIIKRDMIIILPEAKI